MGEKKAGISLILPAHNEEHAVYEMTRETVGALEESGREYEVIVVDDGSTDDTPKEIDRAAREFASVTPITLPENQGKGAALRRGTQASTHELVCFLDADLDLHPSHIGALVREMEEGGADIVIGSKRHRESRLLYPWYRKLYSTVYYLLILALFRLPVKDTQTGIKLFRREVLEKTFPRLVCKQYTLDLELLVVASRLGYKIAEAPIRLDFHKKYGRIRWVDIRNIIVDTMGIFYRLYILRYYRSPLKQVVREEPRISIIIPARELDPMTEECLEKCRGLNYGNHEILLVTDGPLECEPRVPGIKMIQSGPVGPSVKRNMGVSESDAEIVAFIDSDAWPDVDWLRNAVSYFADEGVAAVCGPAVTPARDSTRQQAGGLVYSSSLVSGSTTFRYTHHALREVDDYPSCNLLVRRPDFDRVGGFREEFWPGEDTVLCLELTRELGKKIIYVPNVVVNHHRRPVYLPHLGQVYSYARHRGFFVRKFPETSRKLQFFVPSIFILWLAAGLGLSFAHPLFFYLYISVLGLYLLLCVLSCVKSLDPLLNLLVLPGIIATNMTYGIGFLRGLFSRRMSDK